MTHTSFGLNAHQLSFRVLLRNLLEDHFIAEGCRQEPVSEQQIAIQLEARIVQYNVDSCILEAFQVIPCVLELV